MTDTATRIESRLAHLERLVGDLDLRLRAVEGTNAGIVRAAAVPEPDGTPHPAATDLAGMLALVGRTLVIFAGAYLLRALTEGGTLGAAAGVATGLAYAAVWSVVALRVAPGRRLSATFFGACTPILTPFLIAEASTRFGLLGPTGAAGALAAATGLTLAVAWRRDLHALAWAATVSACGTAAVLLVATGGAIPFTVLLLGLGVATLWLGYDREWKALRWAAAGAADLALAGLAGRALTTPPRDAPTLVMAVQLAALVGYLGSIGVRTLLRGRNVVAFEVVQTGVLLLVGLAGAMIVATETATGTTALGTSLLVLAAASYAVAFAFIDRRQGRGASFHFYTSLAIVFVLAGSGLVLEGAPLAALWAILAAVAAGAGARFDRRALTAHSVAYVSAATLAGGLGSVIVRSLLGPADAVATAALPAAWLTFASAAVCLAAAGRRADHASCIAQWMLAVIAAAGVAGLGIALAARLLPAGAEPQMHAAQVATLRTGVLALAAVAVAALGRRPPTTMFGALLYPVLALGAVKLLLEDVRTSPPALLFVALALYGCALIVGPRLARARRGAESAAVHV